MRYVIQQCDKLAELPAGVNKDRPLGWASQFPGSAAPAKGLRVNIIGFACTNEQKTPLSFLYSQDLGKGPIGSREELVALVQKLRETVVPDGGTCPGLSIEQAIKNLEYTIQADYPLQTVILITDGRFYDMPYPEKAVEGLEAYKALRFAVGIAVNKKDGPYGLTQDEIALQKQQLLTFVGKDRPELFKDLGEEGWTVLDEVAITIAQDLPKYYSLGTPIPRWTWCGWRRYFACASIQFRKGHCRWPNKQDAQWGCKQT
jgi:hypothetical protein